jgi:hypothetical protein
MDGWMDGWFHKMLGNSSVTERLVASQHGLSCMELVREQEFDSWYFEKLLLLHREQTTFGPHPTSYAANTGVSSLVYNGRSVKLITRLPLFLF